MRQTLQTHNSNNWLATKKLLLEFFASQEPFDETKSGGYSIENCLQAPPNIQNALRSIDISELLIRNEDNKPILFSEQESLLIIDGMINYFQKISRALENTLESARIKKGIKKTKSHSEFKNKLNEFNAIVESLGVQRDSILMPIF